jgi:hypothetical protein
MNEGKKNINETDADSPVVVSNNLENLVQDTSITVIDNLDEDIDIDVPSVPEEQLKKAAQLEEHVKKMHDKPKLTKEQQRKEVRRKIAEMRSSRARGGRLNQVQQMISDNPELSKAMQEMAQNGDLNKLVGGIPIGKLTGGGVKVNKKHITKIAEKLSTDKK